MNREEELSLSLARLETIIDSLPFDVWYKDSEGRYLVVNQSLADYLGKTKEEILGKTDLDLYPEDIAVTYVETDRSAIEQKSPGYYETTLDGHLYSEYKKPLFDDFEKARRYCRLF